MSTPVRGDTTRTGLVIEHLERLTNSVNGNPRYLVHFTDGTAHRTMSDASLGSVITSPEYRGVPLAVTFTAHGRIRSARPSLDAIRAGERRAWTDSPIPDGALDRALGNNQEES